MALSIQQVELAAAKRTIQRLSKQLECVSFELSASQGEGEGVDGADAIRLVVKVIHDSDKLRDARDAVTRRMSESPSDIDEALLTLVELAHAEEARLEAMSRRLNNHASICARAS